MDISIKPNISDRNEGILLVTANVGSLFEDPLQLLRRWLEEFQTRVDEFKPKFLALHLQEVGGKTYEKSMQCVQDFINQLCDARGMQDFEVIRIFIDEDFNSPEHFTALGNLYFIHKQLKNVKLWNFVTHTWKIVEGKDIYSGNIEHIPFKEKSKFPQHFFPECKWSRKGFMRTRWDVNNTAFDLVNIHLFHDASNLAAFEEFPSTYCKTRRRALVHTLERFHLDEQNCFVPYFVFGDFNFRCDTEGVVKELTEGLTAHRIQGAKTDDVKFCYSNSIGDNVLTVGKKEFHHRDHQQKFKEPWLKKYDRELEPLRDLLDEFDIEFPPSYPYEEHPDMPTNYMTTRCPSWCDRILMSPQVKFIIEANISPHLYNLIGKNSCMGDHKPVYLSIYIKPNQDSQELVKRMPPGKLHIIGTATFADDVIWTKQSQSEVSALSDLCISCKTRYVQIQPFCSNDNSDTSSNVIPGETGTSNFERENYENVAFRKTLGNNYQMPILKETTV